MFDDDNKEKIINDLNIVENQGHNLNELAWTSLEDAINRLN